MGRVFAPDSRDNLFRAGVMQPRRLGAPVVRRKHRYFLPPAKGQWRDQGDEQSCTEHALTNKLCGWPNPRPLRSLPWQQHQLYREAQKIDEWPGEEPAYYGTSGRAICRAAREHGLISEWWNAYTVDEVLDLLLGDTSDWAHAGPVIIGTNWYDSMFERQSDNTLAITPNARVAGGHETCLLGANLRLEMLYGINSWASMRLFRMSFAVFRRLLQEDGDAIFPVEVPRIATT
jgi:hypothetical protein